MAFSYWPGKSSVTFTHAESTVILESKSGMRRRLSDIAQDVTPDCRLNPLLPNGHAQTFWTAFPHAGPPIHYKRRTFSAHDPRFGGHFAVDFVVSPPRTVEPTKPESRDENDPTGIGHLKLPPRTTYFTDAEFEQLPSGDTKPVLIALHGLSGGSYEVYLRHVLAPLVAQTTDHESEGGLNGGDWEVVVVNSRGCAGSKLTSGVLYNARATWDVRHVVDYCHKIWPNRPLFGIGFSLGANILTNYLGEEGSSCHLSAAVVVSNPWKLECASLALQRSFLGLNVYSKTMGGNMKRLLLEHRGEVLQSTALDMAAIDQVQYLHEFDRVVQCSTWGYPTEGAYYRDASSADSVLAIRTPTLCVHARDDPIACDEAVAYEEIKQNPYLVMCATGGGGHLAWFELGGGRWHPKPVCGFLNAMRDIEFSKTSVSETALSSRPCGPFRFEPTRKKLVLDDEVD